MTVFFRQHKQTVTRTILSVIGVLYCLPEFFITGIQHFPYHDGAFHLSRIIGLSNVWQSPVNFLNFHHNGLMMNICYPWLTMYPAYLFYRIFGSFITAYKMYHLFITILTLWLAFDVMESISKNRLSAFTFSVLYTFCAYRFSTLYNRSALGEVIAMTLWLLVFSGIWNVFFADCTKWKHLAAGMALFSYTHNLSLFIASLIIGLMFVFSVWFLDNKMQRFLSLVKASLTAVILSLGSLVPMFQLFHTDELSIPGGWGQSMDRDICSIPVMIGKALANDTASYSVGFFVMAAFFCLCIFRLISIFRKSRPTFNKGMTIITIFGAVLMFSVSTILPWKIIGERTFLSHIQFAWRLNTCSSLFILAAFSYYLPKMIPQGKYAVVSAVLIILAAAGLHYQSRLSLLKKDSYRLLESDIAAGETVSMDYAPLRAREYRRRMRLDSLKGTLLGEDPRPFSEERDLSEDGTVYTAFITLPESEQESVYADLPVFWYTTQECTLNGERVSSSLSERGGTLVMVHPGQVNEIRITYHYTALAKMAWTVSAISALLFFIYWKKQKETGQ